MGNRYSPKSYVKHPVICLVCGKMAPQVVPSNSNGYPSVNKVPCNACSNEAFVVNPFQQHFVIAAMAKEIARLRLDILDLQGEVDSRGEDR